MPGDIVARVVQQVLEAEMSEHKHRRETTQRGLLAVRLHGVTSRFACSHAHCERIRHGTVKDRAALLPVFYTDRLANESVRNGCQKKKPEASKVMDACATPA